ncbi:MAG: GvpL/GvpF family gas vesicle protein [Gemmatimonadaceae bacterium]
MPNEFVIYAYGLVAQGYDGSRLPDGLDDAPVEVLQASSCGVLASRLPKNAYSPEAIEQSSGDVSWLSPRAMAHDRVLTWAQEHGGVVPLPMFTLFGSDGALVKSMDDRAPDIARVFRKVAGADEFGLRIHRRDEQLLSRIDELDSDIAGLRTEASSAPPGQRYLLERKIDERARGSMRAASQRIAREIFESLRGAARDAVARPLTPDASRTDVTLVLNAAFLVDRASVTDFRAAVGTHMQNQEPRGLVFDFTGPWPPYNFVAEAVSGDRRTART